MNGPIDSGTVSLRTSAVIAVAAISIGMLWQSVKADIADHEKRIGTLESQTTEKLDAILVELQKQNRGAQ
jgi:hypothetical protein